MPTTSSSTPSSFPVSSPTVVNNTVTGGVPYNRYRVTGLKPNSFYSLYSGTLDVTSTTFQNGIRRFGDAATVRLKSNSSGEIIFGRYLYTYFGSSSVLTGTAQLRLVGPSNATVNVPNNLSNPPTPQPGTSNSSGWSGTRPTVPAPVVTVLSTSHTGAAISPVNRTTTTYGNGTQTPLSEVSLYFDYIQTFYIAPSAVDNSQTVMLSSIELFFRQRPNRTNNQSGLNSPAVRICICEVENDQPSLRKVYTESLVRKEYDQIFPDLGANTPTIFTFKSPFAVKTGKQYGIVVNFEDPQFSIWSAKQGSNLLNTSTTFTSGYTGGKLFRASNYREIDNDSNTLDALYQPITDTDLKFKVNIRQFAANQTKTLELVNDDYEFLTIGNVTEGITGGSFIFGERLYQKFGNTSANVSFYKTGTLNIDQNSTSVTGNNTLFTAEVQELDTIVITDGTIGNTDVREIGSIVNNTFMTLTTPVDFTATAAKYSLTATGILTSSQPSTNTIILNNSTADIRNRFISDGVNYITWTSGSGYSNTDYIVFSGGTANGRATITTNTTGHISSLNITTPGYGFTTSPTVTVYQSSGSLRSPSPATITATVGSQLVGEHSTATTTISNVTVLPVNQVIPSIHYNARGGVVSNPQVNFSYSSGSGYTIDTLNYMPFEGDNAITPYTYNPVIISKSLEILNRPTLGFTEGKSAVVRFNISNSSRYESPELHTELSNLYIFSNQINNDSTNEHKNDGNAFSKHITTKVRFDKDRFAEDVRVIASMYRPLGTDVKIYAKIHNSKDEDAFDDKDWSELEMKEATFGDRYYSSSTNPNDLVEVTYGFRQYPKIIKTLTGTASVNSSASNTTVTGIGTSFSSDIANGDIVVLYDPLFANVTYAVVSVANTPTATGFEISSPTSNVSLASATLYVGVTSNSTVNYSHSAFNNIQNDNVARYYSTSTTPFDTYDTFSLKVVLLAENTQLVPSIESLTSIGVSA